MNRNSIFYIDRAGTAAPSCVICNEVVNGATIVVTAGGYSDDVDPMRVGFLAASLSDRIERAGLLFDSDRYLVYSSRALSTDECTALAATGFSGPLAFA